AAAGTDRAEEVGGRLEGAAAADRFGIADGGVLQVGFRADDEAAHVGVVAGGGADGEAAGIGVGLRSAGGSLAGEGAKAVAAGNAGIEAGPAGGGARRIHRARAAVPAEIGSGSGGGQQGGGGQKQEGALHLSPRWSVVFAANCDGHINGPVRNKVNARVCTPL